MTTDRTPNSGGPDGATAFQPAPGGAVEAVIARHTARRAIWVGPVIVAVAALLGGAGAAVAAAIGVAVVVANFLLAGELLSRSARISLSLYHAAALFGFFLRLGLITATLLLVARVTEIDRTALGVSAVVSYLVLLSWETLAVTKGSERELEWSH